MPEAAASEAMSPPGYLLGYSREGAIELLLLYKAMPTIEMFNAARNIRV